MSNWILILTTADHRETLEKIADALVKEKLCGCAQIGGPIESYYNWKGSLECSQEFSLSIKTAANLFDKVAARIKKLHTYDVPQIVALPIEKISDDYAAWLKENTRQ